MATQSPTNVNIRNPLALRRIVDEMNAGKGRNLSETAENLILAEGERRKVARAYGVDPVTGEPTDDNRNQSPATAAKQIAHNSPGAAEKGGGENGYYLCDF